MMQAFDISVLIQNILDSVPFLLPEFVLVLGFLIVILVDLFIKKSEKIVLTLTFLALLFSLITLVFQYPQIPEQGLNLFNNMFLLSKKSVLLKGLTLLGGLLSLVFFNQDARLKTHKKGINDFYSIYLASVLSALILISASNLLMAFIAIEMLSLSSYLIVSYTAEQSRQMESGLKYMLFGVTSSAIMLYGISFLYGFSGSISLADQSIANGLVEVSSTARLLVLMFFVAGIAFKLSAVPFHFWAPDVYEAAPTSVTSYLSTIPKVAVFGWLLSINNMLHLSNSYYLEIIFALSLFTLIVGNVMAVFQKDIKRLLSYSAIGHSGFILMIFVLPEADVFHSLFYYLLVYVVTNIGAFVVVNNYERIYGVATLENIKGKGKNTVVASAVFVVFLVSLIGLPPTGGFVAKFIVFSELISQLNHKYYAVLLIVAVLTTVISLFYYFKIPLNLFLRKSETEDIPVSVNKQLLVLPVLLGIVVLILGLFPAWIKFF